MIKILNKKTEKELNIDTTKINFEYNYNEYSYVGIKQSSIFDNFIYNDKNNLILKKTGFAGEPYKLIINKEILDKNFIDELNKSGMTTISEDEYNKAESFTPVETFIKNHKNEKETDILQ